MTDSEKELLIAMLDELIRSTAPQVSTVAKYGGTLYTVRPEEKEGQFCGVFAYKQHVQLSFARGSQLEDPAAVLTGAGKLRRHINITDPEEIDDTTIVKLIESALSLNY